MTSEDRDFLATVLWMPNDVELREIRDVTKGSNEVSLSLIKKCKSLGYLRKHLSLALGEIHVEFSAVNVVKGFVFEYTESTNDELNLVKKKSNSISYSEAIFSFDCKFRTERCVKDCYERITNLFCNRQKLPKINPEVWMIFDMSCLIEDRHIESASKRVNFEDFSLGNIVGLNTFVSHFSSNSSLATHGYKITQVQGQFVHDLQRLELYFVVGKSNVHVSKRSGKTHKLFKLELPYISIHRILMCNNETFSIYFHYLQPPLLFATMYDESDLDHTDYVSFTNLSPNTDWERIIDIYENSPNELRKEFSMNTVLKLDFRKANYDILIQLKEHCKNFEIYFSPMKCFPAVKNMQITSLNSDNFDSFYALKCLLTRSFEVLDQIAVQDNMKEIRASLKKKSEKSSSTLADVLFHIYYSMDQGNIVLLSNAVEMLFDDNEPKQKNITESSILYIRRAIVTPTHVRFLPLHPTLKSRLLRQCDPSFTLRISVKDINSRGLNWTVKIGRNKRQVRSRQKFFEDYVISQLLKGIKIGNRHYEYLGSSTSQLRSHGLWFYAKDSEGRTSGNIRGGIGNLSEIYLVPKFMARMGQSFSQSMGRITVPQSCTNVDCPDPDILGTAKVYASESDDDTEDDIEECKRMLNDLSGNDDKTPELLDSDRYVFSDGIGRISEKIAKNIYSKLGLEEAEPSAFQIRYAGCKGMLVVDPTIPEENIYFRESMKKFSSKDSSLEIIKTSEPRLLYLNRPFITILEQMGIEKEVFLHLQKQTIKELIGSIFYDHEAEKLLRCNNQLRIDYVGLCESGVSFTEDPFFRSLILAIFKREITLLKNKARISIPEDKGRTMFGVLDETSSLKYGEVFVQYTNLVGDKKKGTIIEGTVVVTKNPCMHPGDVRKFRAVNKEPLRHIRDCIVFPAEGPRPHPDEMAGSDLDGDEYSILWYPDLIFERENRAAMCYSFKTKGRVQEDQDRPVTVADEMQFFCNYIMNDTVGLLASAHLAFADYHEMGIFSRKCLSIAKQYSKALDFAKTGRPAVVEKKHRAFVYPDFMQKLREKNTYLSQKALGYLYRSCKRFEMGLEATTLDNEFSIDTELIYESWECYKESALKALEHYSSQVRISIKTYGIGNEGELISGALSKVSKVYGDRHDYSDLVNILEFEVRKLFQNMEKEFFKEFGGKPSSYNNFTENMFRKASAWYVVTYTQKKGEQNYYGLPWAISDILVRIRKKRTEISSKPKTTSASILTKKTSLMEKIIDKCLERSVSEKFKTFSLKKVAILETAYESLLGWLKLQEKDLLFIKLDELESCLNDVFNQVSSELSACEERYIEDSVNRGNPCKLVSPGYYILESLMSIFDLENTPQNKSSDFDMYQEFGLFAWVTLVKLGTSRKTEVLGILNPTYDVSGGLSVSEENEIDTIRLPIAGSNCQFSESFESFRVKIIHDQRAVSSFLKSLTKVEYIDMRIHEDKGNSFSLRITVKGSQLAVDRFKDFVVAPNFFESVSSEKHPSSLKVLKTLIKEHSKPCKKVKRKKKDAD